VTGSDEIADIYELSPLQQGMLLHSLYGGDADTYVAQRSYMIEGPLDPDALDRAWQQAVAAHTALRTSFHWDELDKPLQVVHRRVRLVIQRQDWSDVDDQRQRERFGQLLADERAAGFDPARPPLQRLHLIRLGADRHGFIWTHHLLLIDGWSVPILVNDVMRRYLSLTVGGPPPAPAPPYRDYIAWLQRQDLDAARDFWSGALAGRAGQGRLAPLRPADPGRGAGPVDELTVSLSGPAEAALRAAAARHRVTLNTVLQAAWALVLQRYSGAADVTFGCTSSGRPAELPDVDRMVGLFTNTLPLRVTVPDDGDLGSWLRDIQASYAAVRRYEYSPLAEVKKWAGAPGPQPLFDSLTILDNYPLAVGSGELTQQLSFSPVNTFEKTSEPLTLIVTPEPQSTVWMLFHRERFAPGAAEEIMECFQAILAAFPGAERIASVAAASAASPGQAGRGDVVTYPDQGQTWPELIERQARATPDAPAVLTDDRILSYGELLSQARRVAAAIGALGAGPGHVVGVCANRSPDMVAGLLGVQLAGAAYLPLDPSLPATRLAFMVSDSGAGVVLARGETADVAREAGARHVLALDDLPPDPGHPGRRPPRGDDAAYVMYTSGSTGRPKGVMITHEAVVNRLLWMQETFELTPGDRVIQKTPFGFDVSVWELFWPLATGAAMVLARPGGHQDAEYLARTFARHAVTVAHFVPSMLQLFLDEPAVAGGALRRVLCSGEELSHSLGERFRSLLPHVELHNLYGPTEATVDVTWWDCSRPGPPGVVPIGFPIANTQAYVLDRRLTVTPDDVPGELYLGGVQLARGYVNRPGLTASTFVAHPLAGPGGRLYRTGDEVRRLRDGSLEFLGRLDQQVKIRGYRIELGEVEHALTGHPRVREAVVVGREGRDGQQLAAYVTGEPGLDPGPVREHLRRELPAYMVPATITVLPALPLTHNGKLNRAALPEPSPTRPSSLQSARPATSREEAVAAAYRDILGLAEADVTASFFDLGGDSFSAVRAVRRIEGATVGLLAAHPSVRELAAALDRAEPTPGILLRLTDSSPPARTLVCVPFGGGSAISYRSLASALSSDVELLAVSLPGHELGGESELRAMDDVARECAEAVLELPDGPVCVYGHCVGVALAVELVRLLEEAHRKVDRLFLAGSYPFYEPGPIGRALAGAGLLSEVTGRPQLRRKGPAADLAEMRFLQSLGGFNGLVEADELAFVMRAFRHDLVISRRYFSQRWPRRGDTAVLTAPITFIAGTDDPMTASYERRHRTWERFGSAVELATVPDGGHYFHQDKPELLARIIEDAL
jgi:amino acid adenylation domain-containing protein